MKDKKKTGTREWSEHSVNCCLGCSHGCLYCYARCGPQARFQNHGGAKWTTEKPKSPEIASKDPIYTKRYDGVVMFPTTHDWTAGTMNVCYEVLKSLLTAGNNVLFVSKLGEQFVDGVMAAADVAGDDSRERLEIRISIGGIDEITQKLWEPGAPTFTDRLEAMAILHQYGFKVSASAEPLLEPWNAVELVNSLIDHGASQVWIGKLNKMEMRLKWRMKQLKEELRSESLVGIENKVHGEIVRLERAMAALEAYQTDEAVMKVYEQLRGNTKVRWKDSYAEVIVRCAH